MPDLTPEQLKELDTWIAIHAMGWKLGPPETILGPMAHGTVTVREWEGSQFTDSDGYTAWYTEDSFRPTVDFASALRVLERCERTVFSVEILYSERYGHRIRSNSNGNTIMGEWAPTLPLAIVSFAKEVFA